MSDTVLAATPTPPSPPGDSPPRRTDDGPPDGFATALGAAQAPADNSHARSTAAEGTTANGDSGGHSQAGAVHGPGKRPATTAAAQKPSGSASSAAPAATAAVTATDAAAAAAAPAPPAPGPQAVPAPVAAAPAPGDTAAPAPAPVDLQPPVAAGAGTATATAPQSPLQGSTPPADDSPAATTAASVAVGTGGSQPAPTRRPPLETSGSGDQAAAPARQTSVAQPPQAGRSGGEAGGDRGHQALGGNQPPVVRTTPVGAPAVGGEETPTAPVRVDTTPSPGVTADPVRAYANLGTLTETTAATMRLALRGGRTVAEITLHPAELGSVRVTMEAHPDGGVSATVTAQTGEAAEALSQAGRELRQALEAQGVTVHGLEVQVATGDGRGNRPGGDAHEQAGAQATAGPAAAGEPESETTIQPARPLPPGSSVDVLA